MPASDSIYLVLDMENDLIHPDGVNYKAVYAEQVSQRQIVKNTRAAIDKARASGVRVGFVRVGFSGDYRECPPNSPVFSIAKSRGIFKLGSWGTQLHPDLGQQEADLDVVKHRVSPFYSTTLEAVLRANGIRRIYCSGVSTNAVVQATVREGHDRDYEIIVVEDGCCAPTAEEHEGAISSMKRFCRLTTSRDLSFD